jgi:hypothetical protein
MSVYKQFQELEHLNDGLFLSRSSENRYKFPIGSVISPVTLLGAKTTEWL